MIRQQGGKYILYDKAGKKILGKHDTKDSAMKQEKAININKAKEKPDAKR